MRRTTRLHSLVLPLSLAGSLLASLGSSAQDSTLAQQAAARKRAAVAQRMPLEKARALVDAMPIQMLDGHTLEVGGLEFSSDGERLVTTSRDGTAWLWDARSGEPIGQLGIHTGSVRATFDPEGERVLTFDRGCGNADLWDGRSGESLGQIAVGDQVLVDAAFAGTAILTADEDGALRLFDARSGEPRGSPGLVTVPILRASSSSDGESVLAIGRDGRVHVWEAAGGPERVLDLPGAAIDEAEFCTDGVRILGQARGLAAVAWPIGAGEPWALRTPEGKPFLGLVWSEDGRRLVAVEDGGAAVLWSVEQRRVLAELGGGWTDATTIRFSPDGQRLMGLRPGEVWVWDAEDGRVAWRSDEWDDDSADPVPTAPIVVFSRDGRRAATWGRGSSVQIWSMEDGAKLGGWEERRYHFTALAFSPDGRRLAVPDDSRGVVILEIGRGAPPVHCSPRGRAYGTVVAPDGRHALAFEILQQGSKPTIAPGRLWDLDRGTLVRPLGGHAEWLAKALFSPDGRRVLTLGNDDLDTWEVHVSDVAQGTSRTLWRGTGKAFHQASWSPDGERVFLEDADGGSVLLDGDGRQLDARFPTLEWQERMQVGVDHRYSLFSPDGVRLATAHTDLVVRLWDGRTGAAKGELAGHTRTLTHLAFSSDGTRLASASLDGTVRIWDPRTAELVSILEGHSGAVYCAAFDPSGELLATGGADGTVRLWDPEAGGGLEVLEGHQTVVLEVVFSPDGKLLLSTSNDSAARVWRLPPAGPAIALEGHTSRVVHPAFTPDSKRILTSGFDGATRVWRASDGALLLTHIEYADGGWLAFDPRGYYVDDGSASTRAVVRVGRRSLPLSSYAAILRDPERVAASLRGETTRVPSLPDAPIVRIVAPRTGAVEECKLDLEALVEDRYGVEKVSVWQDDVELPDERVKHALSLADGDRSARLVLHLEIAESAETTVRVRARNRRGISSATASVHVRHELPQRDLYVLAIGVADYDDDRLDLLYPVKDVDDLVARLRAQESTFYAAVHVERLVDREVTAAAVKRAQERFLLRARPQDTILVFVAGHGMRTEANEYWYLTSAATPDEPFDGIDRDSLEKLVTWERLHAARRLLLIDTCQSGTAVGARGTAPLFARADLESLIDAGRGGLYIMAASAEKELARERDGNGLFTRAILEGLDGAADVSPNGNGDGFVTIEELKRHAEGAVLEHSAGRQQPTFPEVRGGENFRVARVLAARESSR